MIGVGTAALAAAACRPPPGSTATSDGAPSADHWLLVTAFRLQEREADKAASSCIEAAKADAGGGVAAVATAERVLLG